MKTPTRFCAHLEGKLKGHHKEKYFRKSNKKNEKEFYIKHTPWGNLLVCDIIKLRGAIRSHCDMRTFLTLLFFAIFHSLF
jgi:hypothetical protein